MDFKIQSFISDVFVAKSDDVIITFKITGWSEHLEGDPWCRLPDDTEIKIIKQVVWDDDKEEFVEALELPLQTISDAMSALMNYLTER